MRMTSTHTVLAACMILAVASGCQATGRARTRASQDPARDDARITLGQLGSNGWRLTAWNADEPAAPTPAVSLRYAAGSFTGRSACNRYTAPVEQRSGRGAIAVGAIAVTRMMCPPPIIAVERRFLAALGSARALEMRDGHLGVVATDEDGRAVTLVFSPDSHPAD